MNATDLQQLTWEQQFCLWRSDAAVAPTWFHAVPADVIDHLGLFCGPVQRNPSDALGHGMQLVNGGELCEAMRRAIVYAVGLHRLPRQLGDISTKWQWDNLLFENNVERVLADMFDVSHSLKGALRVLSNLCKRASSARVLATNADLCRKFVNFMMHHLQPDGVGVALACYQALLEQGSSEAEMLLHTTWARMCDIAFIPSDGFSGVHIDPSDFVALLAFGRRHALNVEVSPYRVRMQCDWILSHTLHESQNVEHVSALVDAFEDAGLPCRGKHFMRQAVNKYHRCGELLERLAQMPPHEGDNFTADGGEQLARQAIGSGRIKALLLYVHKDPAVMLPVVELELMRQFGSCQEMLRGGRHPDPDWQHLIQLLRERHDRFGQWLGAGATMNE